MFSFHHPTSSSHSPVPQILYSLLSYFPSSDQRGSSHSKPWFCTKLKYRNIKARPPSLFFPQSQVQVPIRFELCHVDLWDLCKLLPCLLPFPFAFPISPFVLCFILYLVLNVSHGMDLAMGMLHDPFTFHIVFLLSFLPVLTFVMWLY